MNGREQGNKPSSQNKFTTDPSAWKETATQIQAVNPPVVSLPKGGGAIKGIGEKFEVNSANGTASFSVPIPVSPGRSDFSPQLNLSYNSGSGNSPFGFGWHLSSPAITRKTDKGLPRYRDGIEPDVFILSGAEDLVPVLDKDTGDRITGQADENGKSYTIYYYRPRTEGLFARIEKWVNDDDGDVHWRSITKNNLLTLYGTSSETRIYDPAEPWKIFSWLIDKTLDDKGNIIIYTYKQENNQNVPVSAIEEKNRLHSNEFSYRYLKHIKYGNTSPVFRNNLPATNIDTIDFLFEILFDYNEHDPVVPDPDSEDNNWSVRMDPFSFYRAGFEQRIYRLCRRILVFHRFPELGDGPCLVRSMDFAYNETAIASYLLSITTKGYTKKGSTYSSKSFPPLEFTYTKAEIDKEIYSLPPESCINLPSGIDNQQYKLVDLDGEGVSGIFTEQGEGWFYKPNLGKGKFGALQKVMEKPPPVNLQQGRWQLMDLAGDGKLDIVQLDKSLPGFYERTGNNGWMVFRNFKHVPNLDWNNPELKFIDITGDGHADIMISEDEVFTWYPSLAEDGFGEPEFVHKLYDEERGPVCIFADQTQSIYLADMAGDGLTDIVRIRNGDVCYWPNLGYGRFGARIRMDNAPCFDTPERFDQKRIRLADIDGSGTTDIIYLMNHAVALYFNQSGNSFSSPRIMENFPRVDNLSSISIADLLGNGTACIVWSSPLPGDRHAPIKYIDLMSSTKPHLLKTIVNNMGSETHVYYKSSTYFYLKDKEKGKPWITKLPFPVYVVERSEVYDCIGKNRFITRYAYHHGYFDGDEREFRGFGMVERWDTEEYSALTDSNIFTMVSNMDPASHIPPVYTKTWFHTGAFFEGEKISRQFENKYFGYPDSGDPAYDEKLHNFQKTLLPDTVLPGELSVHEDKEACRALKGMMLRQEVYAEDDSGKKDIPYMVTESNFTVKVLQHRFNNKHAVFFTHPRESIGYHYERNPSDPRIKHQMILRVDDFGNTERTAEIQYPRFDKPGRLSEQEQTHMVFTVNRFTNYPEETGWYRVGIPVETRTFEIVTPPQTEVTEDSITLHTIDGIMTLTETLFPVYADPVNEIYLYRPPPDNVVPYIHWDWRKRPGDFPAVKLRLIEHLRTLYVKDDLTGSHPLGQSGSMGLPFETCYLAFNRELLETVYRRDSGINLLPGPVPVLRDEGGYILSNDYKAAGLFPSDDDDNTWWLPAGQVKYSPGKSDTPAAELAFARGHFFLPHRIIDPFGNTTIVRYDDYKFFISETSDPLGNIVRAVHNYRVLQPELITDPNGNQSRAGFDVLGMVAGTAIIGKSGEGDSLAGFNTDVDQEEIDAFILNPRSSAAGTLLQQATTRIIYDITRFYRYKNIPGEINTSFFQTMILPLVEEPADQAFLQTCYQTDGTKHTIRNDLDDSQKTRLKEIWTSVAYNSPIYAATLIRETHVSDLSTGEETKIQVAVSYSDGFGREIQKKIQAEPGQVTRGGPEIDPRWVGSGWTIFNNKAKPVRQYEPFFSRTHQFEFAKIAGVSPVLFYDPLGRVAGTLHPNHTYEKVVFDAWQQETWDVNDTVMVSDPKTDPDLGDYFKRLKDEEYLPAWHERRRGGGMGPHEQAAAQKTEMHAGTPTITHLDAIGRPFLSIAHNKFERKDETGTATIIEEEYSTRINLDIESNQREIIDALTRIVMRYDYDMLGKPVCQASMDAGKRWTLNDAAGNPLYAWDSRDQKFHILYDELRRPTESRLQEGSTAEKLVHHTIYGESQPNPEANNLRGQVYKVYDQAGVVTSLPYDFKGNLLTGSRQLAEKYDGILDWAAPVEPVLESIIYTGSTKYDVMNRPIQVVTPHGNQPGTNINIIQPVYNEANLLDQVHAWLEQNQEPDALLDPATAGLHAVTNINYNEKGQRVLITYGNGVHTTYAYDEKTFRLTNLFTARGNHGAGECTPQPVPRTCQDPPVRCARLDNSRCILQNLFYTYDPAGNITHIRDSAQQTVFFRNRRVEPDTDYIYDALYRLIYATGREHLGQSFDTFDSSNPPPPPGAFNHFYTNKDHPGDGNALGTYSEEYIYDAVGNFLEMHHHGLDPRHNGWNRIYHYREPSLLEPGKFNNRLSNTVMGTNTPLTESYLYNEHGSMTRMPHFANYPDPATPNMHWDFKDQLQRVDLGGGGTAYYVYDAGGQRVRKVWEKSPGLKVERIYLGGFEIFRRYNGAGNITLERETLHIMDDKQRIALVETRIQGTETGVPRQVVRYQSGNHLGSASLELDREAKIISYEEYYPYGSTSYQAVRRNTEVPLKRYRYSGKEKDEESGFYYYGARYYACWLGRWIKPDPAGLVDGLNLYQYILNNPLNKIDHIGLSAEDEVLTEANTTLQAQGIPTTEQLQFELIDNSGKPLLYPKGHEKAGQPIRGTMDTAFIDPRTGELVMLEGKGYSNSSRTDPQKVYHPKLEKGAKIRITGKKGAVLGIFQGDEIQIKEGNFLVIAKDRFKEFKKRFSKIYPQKMVPWLGFNGKIDWYTPEEAAIQYERVNANKPRIRPNFSAGSLIIFLIGFAITIPARLDAASEGDILGVVSPEAAEVRDMVEQRDICGLTSYGAEAGISTAFTAKAATAGGGIMGSAGAGGLVGFIFIYGRAVTDFFNQRVQYHESGLYYDNVRFGLRNILGKEIRTEQELIEYLQEYDR